MVMVENEMAPLPDVLNHEPILLQQQQQQQENVLPPPIDSLTIEARGPVPVEAPMEQQALPPEQLYYQQPPRPISEMLGGGSFYFLQVRDLFFKIVCCTMFLFYCG